MSMTIKQRKAIMLILVGLVLFIGCPRMVPSGRAMSAGDLCAAVCELVRVQRVA
jgi:hypothetical protein